MKRTLLAVALLCACHKSPAKPVEAPPKALGDAPPPPALEIAAAPATQELRIAAAHPRGKLVGATHPTITFNQPVVALETISDKDVSQGITLQPAVKGAWHWLGSSSIEYVNEEPYPGSTHFTVTIPAGLTALSGAKLQSTERIEFDTPSLAVDSTQPSAYDCRWSTPTQPFRLFTNQPVKDPASAFVYEVSGKAIAAKVTDAQSLYEEAKAKGKSVELRQFAQDDLRMRYELKPAENLPLDAPFTLRLADGAKAAGGELPPEPFKLDCHVMGAMQVVAVRACGKEIEHCSRGPLEIELSNPVGEAKTLRAALKITPAATIEWDEQSDDLGISFEENRTHARIFGKFQPGQKYAVHLDAGIADTLGQKAPQSDGEVVMSDLLPSLYVGQDLALLEASGDGLLPAQVTNLGSLQADLWALTPAEMAKLELCNDCEHGAVPARPPDAPLTLALSYPKNEPHLQGIDLRAALKGAKTGLVVARVAAPGTDFANHPYRVLAQITDLAVHAKIGATSSLAWVTSVQSGAPVANAQVQVLSADGEKVAEATTDASGLAQLPGYGILQPNRANYAAPRVFVAAMLGTDLGYSISDDSISTGVMRTFDVLQPTRLGVLFTDRGIYRPGDVVHVKGILRNESKGELWVPEGDADVKITDPQGNEAGAATAHLSRYGTFSFDFTVPKDARLGGFSIGADNVSGGFLVAEYRAPQFRVDVQIAKSEQLANEDLSGNVIARYLFGAPMSQAKAEWSLTRSSEDFAPPKTDGFRFGRNTWSWDDGEPRHDNGSVGAGQGEIGKDGTLRVDAGKLTTPDDRPARYTLEAEVEDVSRQRVANRASILVHPAAHYVGLGAQSLFVDAGKEISLPVIAATPAGERVPAQVKVTASLRSWHSIKKRNFDGTFETMSEPVSEPAGSCEVAAPGNCKLTLQKPGLYELRAESKDAQGRLAVTTLSVYAIGQGFAAWQENDATKVDVVADKQSYSVGDVAHLLIKSPFDKCRALISIEREGIADAHVVELSGTASTIDVPVTEKMVPNAFVGVVLVRGRSGESKAEDGDPGRPAVRVGYGQLNVGLTTKKLAVSVKADREEYKPRENAPIEVQVKDAAGKPVRAEVQIYAVDAAVLQLTQYQLPDVLAAFFPEHGLAVSIGEPLPRLVVRQRFGEKGDLLTPGGGGGLGPSGDVRSKFVTTPLWTTAETDAQGIAHAQLALPDNLTTFRIFAVAATDSDRFGGGESSLRVALPLLVLPALPRLARVGDEFEAGVALHSVKTMQVKVSAQVEGLELAGPAEREIAVEANVAKEVRFKFKATAQGTATLRFRAAGGGLSDGVEQKIPIQLPVGLEAVAVAGDTQGKVSEGIVPPQGVRPEVGGLELQLSSTALGGLQESFNQLVEYPYGCLEQLSSRLVPFVARREVQRTFGQAPNQGDDQVVADTIGKIERLQAPSGGFYYWPGEWCAASWASVYATLALHRASENGYAVKPEALASARKFLAKVAAGQSECGHGTLDSETRIFALQVLARMKKPLPSYYDQFYAQRKSLPLFSKAQLADAIAVGKGKRAQAEQLLQDALDLAKDTTREVHFEEADEASWAPLFNSDVRTTGMVLQTLVELHPDHPYVSKISRYLVNVRHGGRYRNTQEAAYALMGLAEVVRVRERTAPDFVARVALGAAEIANAPFKGRSMTVVEKKIAMKDLPQGTAPLPLDFKVDGTGSLFYTALLRYAPAELPMKPRNEGLYVQRWFEPFDAPGKLTTDFAAGDLVRVRARIATPQERNYLAVDVPIPAGLEAIDTMLATSRQQLRAQDEEAQEGEESQGLDASQEGFYSPFVYSEKRDDRVVYFADHLPPGVHTLSFVARATTPGKFLLTPAKAEEMYAPEVFGRSEGGSVTVAAQTELTSTP